MDGSNPYFEKLVDRYSSILHESNRVVISLSGGLDSSTALRFLYQMVPNENILAISIYYGQKQSYELECARHLCNLYDIRLLEVPMDFYGNCLLELSDNKGISNIKESKVAVPKVEEVIGHPQPITYIPNRNAIFISLLAGLAEAWSSKIIISGFQVNDEYQYWDTTPMFIEAINGVMQLNRDNQIKLLSPLVDLSKTDELKLMMELEGNLDIYKHTWSCYNAPDANGLPCQHCNPCVERRKAFANLNQADPIL